MAVEKGGVNLHSTDFACKVKETEMLKMKIDNRLWKTNSNKKPKVRFLDLSNCLKAYNVDKNEHETWIFSIALQKTQYFAHKLFSHKKSTFNFFTI